MMNDIRRRDKWLVPLSRIVLICSPFLLLLILSAALGKNAFQAQPLWLDELCFWRSLFSWDQMGFATGFNGMYGARLNLEEITFFYWSNRNQFVPTIFFNHLTKLLLVLCVMPDNNGSIFITI